MMKKTLQGNSKMRTMKEWFSYKMTFCATSKRRQQNKNTIVTSIILVVWTYHAREFCVRNILADGSLDIVPNVTSRNEHVTEIKRYIRTVNEG